MTEEEYEKTDIRFKFSFKNLQFTILLLILFGCLSTMFGISNNQYLTPENMRNNIWSVVSFYLMAIVFMWTLFNLGNIYHFLRRD